MNTPDARSHGDPGRALRSFELVANVSLLFSELPFLDRFAAARDEGFYAVEAWWPFSVARPRSADVERFLHAIDAANVRLTGLNLFAGDMTKGDRGILNRPDRREEFQDNLDLVAELAAQTGCRLFNALYGQQIEGLAGQEETALGNLATAIETLAPYDAVILLEPLSRGLNGAYPIQTASDATEVIAAARERADIGRAAVLFDTFHLTNNGENLVAVLRDNIDDIAHVQLADSPGRGEPGSGNIDFPSVIQTLIDVGYTGRVACEYVPTARTSDCFGWLDGML